MLRQRARTPVEALRKRSWDCRIKSGNDERNERNERKKNIGSETPRDATVVCRAIGRDSKLYVT
jgi:hypothetical protein